MTPTSPPSARMERKMASDIEIALRRLDARTKLTRWAVRGSIALNVAAIAAWVVVISWMVLTGAREDAITSVVLGLLIPYTIVAVVGGVLSVDADLKALRERGDALHHLMAEGVS